MKFDVSHIILSMFLPSGREQESVAAAEGLRAFSEPNYALQALFPPECTSQISDSV